MAAKLESSTQGFFRLPPEIRHMIYDQVLDQSKIFIVNEYCPERRRNAYKTHEAPGLLFACQLIHRELIPTIYARSHFVFDFGEKPIYGINAFARRVGSINASLIKRITVCLDDFFPRRTCYKTNNPLQRLQAWMCHFPQLQELRLKYSTQITSHHFLIGAVISDLNVARYGELFDNVLVLLESRREDLYRYGQRRSPFKGRIVQRLLLTGNHLRLVNFMVLSTLVPASWYSFCSLVIGTNYERRA